MWYYAQNGERKGPVSEEALREMARNGSLHPADLVWREGMAEWATASQATGFEFAGGETLYTPPAEQAAAPAPAYEASAPGSPHTPAYSQQASPYAAPQSQIATAATFTDYLPWAIAATFLCCNFTGIVAVVFAVKTKSAHTYGDHAEVQRSGRLAKLWFWWTFGIGFTFWVLYLGFYAFIMAAAMSAGEL